MRHTSFKNMWEALLDTSDEVLVAAKSKRAALYHATDGRTWFLGGDFSGTEEEREAEVHRLMDDKAA